MPEVTIYNLHSKTIHCKSKTEKLLDILLSETDWMHACGMKGRCTTCTAVILEGHDNLSELSEAELRFIKLGRLGENQRLSCQCKVSGDVVIKTPELYKLPHLEYSE
ncbi:2Fe-2S iron-sulfur cluster-binding protein [Marinoscillum pacificum]|uniref:2Fe-2S iron-sulfur cluster-binding protein n=1 Tax=Marinoscillum pacificum TaxID=392723 RepID=UPI002157CCDB|nr:(2Fe-2S)-binding protein [Marinoscillum pacificum]|tara:strand:+ start:189 stop:509 length:321 start_codon:yes stop_codon:yes gene_type:complete